MDFSYTEEQQALQDSLRRFLTKEYDFEKRRHISRTAVGYSPQHWATLAEMGVLGLGIPEEHGGMNGGPVDTMLIMESFGRAMVLEPYLPTVVLCAGLVRDLGSETQRAALLPPIVMGELLMAFAHYEQGSRYALEHVATSAKRADGGYVLNGAKSFVLSGTQAGKLIVSARTAGGPRDRAGLSLFVVDREAPGVSVQGYVTQDGGRAAEVKLANVRVGADALLGHEGGALPVIERAVDLGIAALCAEAVGAMDALVETTREYLKTRKQFGVPIGKFQVLQHRMADMLIATEQARSMAIVAAVKVGSPDAAERRRMVSSAKALVGQSARYVGQQAVQLHGGMGVTDELAAAHLFKRLTVINATFGDADHHLAQVSDALLVA
ncbi:pimeloyl-CoA dehydrogenase small subunit [Pyxidicoccus fallax]|uniref:Pimeloyl-CoA dehydrogenase small subunit n=1 Tax=Pyxidicoccus fallax TaxID=394095 RepID=A0A848LY59_9BACT|nr:acyl-CoA dehydrogenase [Pyxidicoccus fallax]NMO22561.1 pimeloyl-CoA dehydrogenase small subunit [Pyxidicoccus fallax]NPC85478.1 pimeloyl-CoA dehydrogenase small subunit [Pyxidicoccus fallax]